MIGIDSNCLFYLKSVVHVSVELLLHYIFSYNQKKTVEAYQRPRDYTSVIKKAYFIYVYAKKIKCFYRTRTL